MTQPGYETPENRAAMYDGYASAAPDRTGDGEPNDGPGPDGHHVVTGECFACMVGVATGPESHGDRCPHRRRPGDRDQQQAAEVARAYFGSMWGREVQVESKELTKRLAVALAAARAEEAARWQAKIEALAVSLRRQNEAVARGAGLGLDDFEKTWRADVVNRLRALLDDGERDKR